jgi:hypothetical protein
MNKSHPSFNKIGLVLFILCLVVSIIGCNAIGNIFPGNQPESDPTSSEAINQATQGVASIPTEKQVIETSPTSVPPQTPTVLETDQLPAPQETPEPTLEEIPPDIAEQMDQIERQVIGLRNLQPTGFVSRALLTRDQLRQKIETEFLEDYSPEEAQDDTIVLSALGLLESGFDMFTFYQDLLSEQIAGQYDHKKKEMDVVQGFGFGGTERLTYAHEYTHALQDQNFDIENGLEYNTEACEEDSERCAAIQALLEGDASLLELDWFSNFATPQDVIDIQEFYQDYESPIYNSAPDFLREDFIFPYIYGQTFVEHLHRQGGWDAVNAAYIDLPVSTEQILHPERYPDDKPDNVLLPDLIPVLGDGWRELDQGIMGEWYTFLILAHGLNSEAQLSELEAQTASDGWGGDAYVAYYDDQNLGIVFVMHTSWEDLNEASQFYSAFQRHSTSRFGAPSTSGPNQFGWIHDGGYTELRMQDQYTTWILAPDEEIARSIWSAIQ